MLRRNRYVLAWITTLGPLEFTTISTRICRSDIVDFRLHEDRFTVFVLANECLGTRLPPLPSSYSVIGRRMCHDNDSA